MSQENVSPTSLPITPHKYLRSGKKPTTISHYQQLDETLSLSDMIQVFSPGDTTGIDV